MTYSNGFEQFWYWMFSNMLPSLWAFISSNWILSFTWMLSIIGLVIGLIISSRKQ